MKDRSKGQCGKSEENESWGQEEGTQAPGARRGAGA